MTVTVRNLSVSVTFAGNVLTNVITARGQVTADGGWPTCSVFVTAKPSTGNEEDTLSVVAGAGNNVTRFTGRLRRFRTSAFPKALELVCMGTLAYAAEWAPDDDLELDDLGFPSGGTDQALVQAILDQVPGITYTAANIAGTGITLGTEAPEAFIWRAGTSAWDQISQIDRATLYRTYQQRDGTIRRVRMIGHPNTTDAFTLADADALDGSSGSRDTERTRNNVRVFGHDYGDGLGSVTASRTATPITGTPDRWSTFTSDLIESGEDPPGTPDGFGGLQAGDIADDVQSDVNKEFVEATILSWRDDTHGPGQTCLLDMLNRLAIGESMWVQGYGWEASDGWYSTYSLSGGGLEQSYTPPPT